MKFKLFLQSEKVLYISKILSCAVVITLLSIIFDKDKTTNFFVWASLTAFSTLQFSRKAKVNFNQIMGNIIGSVIGIIIWMLMSSVSAHLYYINLEYWFLILGIFVTTLLCIMLKHSEYCGIALSSFLIVTIYDVAHHTIEGALSRILFCIIGCFIAYMVDLISRKLEQKFHIMIYEEKP
ncbi:FUSC family protein [Acinetobacter sp. MB5]|uniref:FUSC family protein n=1 Tax=Acinetobacter sp. MB5 TaxID=2069438 RepID=UPI000DD05F9E|nr:FUSC family protein [Acinetobacter sp. MB5]